MKNTELIDKVIGKKAVVIDVGKVYTSYDTMFERLGFAETSHNSGSHLKKGQVVTVFNAGFHEERDILLLAIRDGRGNEALMDSQGLVTVAEMEEDPETFYSIGDRFRISGRDYLLSTIGENKVVLTNLRKGTILNPGRTKVKNLYKITEEELSKAIGLRPFQLISKVDSQKSN